MIGLPKNASIAFPMGLLVPNKTISKNPTTVGGRTSGKVNIVSTAVFPKKRRLEKILAASTPNTNTKITETVAISSESFKGVQKSLLINHQSNAASKPYFLKVPYCLFAIKKTKIFFISIHF